MAQFAPRPLTLLILNALAAMTLGGCATDDALRQEVGALSTRLEEMRARLTATTSRMEGDEKRLGKIEADLANTAKRVADTAASPEQAHARIDDLIQDFGKACFRIGENKQAIVQANQRIDDLLAMLNTTQERAKASDQRMESALLDIAGTRDRVATLESGAAMSAAITTDKGVVLRPAPAMNIEPVALPVAIQPVATATASTVGQATTPALEPVARDHAAPLATSAAPAAPTAAAPMVPAQTVPVALAPAAPMAAAPVDPQVAAPVPAAIAELPARVDETRQRQVAQGDTLAALEKRLVAVESSLAEKPAVAGDARPVTAGELAEVNRQLADLRSQASNANDRLAGHDAALDSATQRIKSLERMLASLPSSSGNASTTAPSEAKRTEGDATRLIADLHANLSTLDKRVATLEGGQSADAERLAELDRSDKALQSRLSAVESSLAGVSATAKEALERAIAAGKLAEGKLLLETVLTDDISQFQFDKATLSKAAKDELKAFAEKLKAENKNVYIEIQGHTDNVGSARGNLELGQARADAVMAFLHAEAGLPLHRMAAISYGETRPVGDNKTKAGRALNRRVVLVVLK